MGSHLVDRLAAEGHEVVAVDDLSSGRRENLASCFGKGRFEFLEGDFAAEPALSKLAPGSVVVHLAAKVGVPGSLRDPELTHEVNVTRTLRLLGGCAKRGVGRVVFASSAAVYGDAPPPLSESGPVRALSPYGASKIACEAYCEAYQRAYGLPTVVLRFMNVYGPRMDDAHGGVMSEFAGSVERGVPLVVHGDGKQTRDFVHVSDAVEAIMLAISSERAAGETLNVGTGTPTSISSLAEMFVSAGGRPGPGVSHVPPREGDVRHSYADTTKSARVIGFAPKKKLPDGVAEFMAWRSGGRAGQGGVMARSRRARRDQETD
jgi:UDP-glucose 4-epimerase